MRYFKVHRGFGENDYIPIDETELKKAVYAHVTGKVAVLNNGTISGNVIQMISPDYNRAMGWNNGYKPEPQDWEEIHRKHKNYNDVVGLATVELQSLLEGNDPGKVKLWLTEPLPESRQIGSGRGSVKQIGEVLKEF